MRAPSSRLTGVLVIATLMAAVGSGDPAFAQPPNQTGSPRQSWAHEDGFFVLQPPKPISPASVADRLMIEDAFNHWAIGYDEGNLDVLRTLFTERGTLEATRASAARVWVNTGADEIIAAVKRDRASQSDQRRHAISNVVLNALDGKRASAAAYGVVTVAAADDLYLGATVLYVGDLEKQADGTWRFTKLVIGLDAYRTPTRNPNPATR